MTWEESVAHKGSPFRISILDEEENVRMVLLDHIPHWDAAAAMPYVEKSYVPYHITVDVPDVKCDKVSGLMSVELDGRVRLLLLF